MKRIAIFGSTGSIGRKTLEVVGDFPGRFQVVALSTYGDLERLKEQVERFQPEVVNVVDGAKARELQQLFSDSSVSVTSGVEGMVEAVERVEMDMLVQATVGSSGLLACLRAIDRGVRIALANKEVLVMAGEIVMARARAAGAQVIPIDSEHSAILQCLEGKETRDVRRIILTASGGPFRELLGEELERVTVEDALRHPTWEMGRKITVDSATLMNKGFEVIEAHHLFGVDVDRIEVIIHPQSVVHSLVEFRDGSILGQMSVTDMYLPIQNALTYPERLANKFAPLDLAAIGELTFEKPDSERFPCLQYAYEAAEIGGTMPAVLNAANEVAVHYFLQGRLTFTGIAEVIRHVMDEHEARQHPDLECIREADRWARLEAENMISITGERFV